MTPDPRADLEWIARDYAAILRSAHSEELDLPTNGTRWTNRQLLFHVLLGQRITRMVIVVMGVFSRLPPGASRLWSAGMSAATPLYHRINFLGPLVGARLVGSANLERQMESVTAQILRFQAKATPHDLHRGMTVASSWDPYFTDWMDRADVLAWAPKHYRHHRQQLTLTTLPPL